MPPTTNDAPSFSLTQARGIVRDLFLPRQSLYWLDFLTTISCWPCLLRINAALVRLGPGAGVLEIGAGRGDVHRSVPLFLSSGDVRARGRFTSPNATLSHFVSRGMSCVAFHSCCRRLLITRTCEHHRRKLFGTEHDGEYLPLASMSPWCILIYLSQCLWAPPLVVLLRRPRAAGLDLSAAAALAASAPVVAGHGPDSFPPLADATSLPRHPTPGNRVLCGSTHLHPVPTVLWHRWPIPWQFRPI